MRVIWDRRWGQWIIQGYIYLNTRGVLGKTKTTTTTTKRPRHEHGSWKTNRPDPALWFTRNEWSDRWTDPYICDTRTAASSLYQSIFRNRTATGILYPPYGWRSRCCFYVFLLIFFRLSFSICFPSVLFDDPSKSSTCRMHCPNLYIFSAVSAPGKQKFPFSITLILSMPISSPVIVYILHGTTW